jgi:glycosyltransferase 2 family protein
MLNATKATSSRLQSLLQYLKYVLGPLLAVLLLWLSLRHTDLSALWDTVMGANPLWIFLAFLVMNLAHVMRAHRWRYLLGNKYRQLSLWPLWSALMLGYGINVVLPRVGEISRPLYLSRISIVGTAESLATVFVERFLDLLMLPILLGLSFLAVGETFLQAFDHPLFHKTFLGLRLDVQGISLLILGVCSTAALGLIGLVYAYNRGLRHWCHRQLPHAIVAFVEQTVNGLTVLRGRQIALATGIDTLLIWTGYVLSMYLLTFSIDLGGTTAPSVLQAIILLTAATFGLMFPTPGGLGSYGFAVSLALQTIYAVPLLQANAYALLANVLLVILPAVVASALVFLVTGRRRLPVLPSA